jgi:hypothetical protein
MRTHSCPTPLWSAPRAPVNAITNYPFQQQNNDVTDIIIDESPAPMEVEELPNVQDCELLNC